MKRKIIVISCIAISITILILERRPKVQDTKKTDTQTIMAQATADVDKSEMTKIQWTDVQQALPIASQSTVSGAANIIQKLSKKIFHNQAEKNLLRNALMSPDIPDLVIQRLTSSVFLDENHLEERLRALDIVYEGMKFQDKAVRTRYMDLVKYLFNSQPDKNLDTEARHQFFGDRVEMALVLSKIDANLSSYFSGASQAYFKRAREITPLYRVSL